MTNANDSGTADLLHVRIKGEEERSALRKLIIQYTDELLKRAIVIDTAENDEETDPSDEYHKFITSFLPRPSKILEGIALLYAVDIERANARMRQYFEAVQKIQSMNEQLNLCYAMLRCLGAPWWSPLTDLGMAEMKA